MKRKLKNFISIKDFYENTTIKKEYWETFALLQMHRGGYKRVHFVSLYDVLLKSDKVSKNRETLSAGAYGASC